MQGLSTPFLLTAARVYKHEFTPANVKLQPEPKLTPTLKPEALHSYQHHLLPLAQLQGVQAVKEVTPIQAPPFTDLVIIGLGLLLVFWIGNFVVPDFIFNKAFKPEGSKQDARQSILDGIVGGNEDSAADSKEFLGSMDKGTVRGTGFSRASKRGSRQ